MLIEIVAVVFSVAVVLQDSKGSASKKIVFESDSDDEVLPPEDKSATEVPSESKYETETDSNSDKQVRRLVHVQIE